MSIQHYFNKAIRILRLKADSNFLEHHSATGTTDAQIQRLAANEASEQYGVFGANYRAWVDIGIDIREGDRVRDPDNNFYEVIAVIIEGQNIAMNEHQLILMKLLQEAVRS